MSKPVNPLSLSRHIWVCRSGSNYTSSDVADRIARATGAAYTVADLERTYPIGAIVENGGLWFQRVAP